MILKKLPSPSDVLKNKRVLLVAFILLLVAFDIGLYLMDLFIGKERGVVFSFKLFDIILVTNLACLLVLILFFLSLLAIRKYQYIKKWLTNLTLVLTTILVTIAVIECLFYVLLKIRNSSIPPSAYSVVIDDNVFKRDEILGFSLTENSSNPYKNILISPKNDTTIIYSNEIVTDKAGFRKVDIAGMNRRSQYALFFGCSFTFGTGVGGSETVPYLFAKSDSTYCAYNFAVSGYGTQSMLTQLQYKKLRNLVTQDSGICFYIYIPDHIPRVIGDMRIFNSFGTDLPNYDYVNGHIKYKGTFRNSRPFISSLYYALGKSNFMTYFQINLPLGRFNSHYKKTCDIINESYIEYQKQFKSKNFFVILYPGDDTIAKYLEQYDIKFINFSHLFDGVDRSKYFYPYDGHPTKLANQHLVAELIKSAKNYHGKN